MAKDKIYRGSCMAPDLKEIHNWHNPRYNASGQENVHIGMYSGNAKTEIRSCSPAYRTILYVENAKKQKRKFSSLDIPVDEDGNRI